MALLGLFWIVLFISIPVGIAYLIHKMQGGAAGRLAKKRDREIETYMRLGMRDAEAQERIARQIMDERGY